ncbi:vanin-like protein 1 isoform X2 [Contarinia nasturtii]|nr:vanin-like protein 1 isoform X2 [Contarinia nasturtii]XP_031634767.1 vanin-like protein 1 isoform X2 [Contarinia nasturtii]XP_031634768.1 vanin-like protein 1 isoform X2 [Contarinia nasturtii]
MKEVDIMVLPEGLLNRRYNTTILLPNTEKSYCDDPNIHFVLRNISCAARKVRKYVVINLNVRVNCSHDDQSFCAYQDDSTNLYNMAIAFDRNGDMVARYRKYHLFGETGVQQTEKPDRITFKTDFNVTFGVCICFDLFFDEPTLDLVQQGIKHFVYPTKWYSEIPYLSAVQYQQSWAYANNVNLLAANINLPDIKCSGSGIFSGRSGALQVVVNETPTTKILVAKVPVHLPADDEYSANTFDNVIFKETAMESGDKHFGNNRSAEQTIAMNLGQEKLTDYTVKFLDFTASHYKVGSVCNEAICCNYTIEVTDNGEQKGKSSYSYAITVFSGRRKHGTIENLLTGQDICGLVACTDRNSKHSCGIRLPTAQVQNRYHFKKLHLRTVLSITHMKIMPNTLTQQLLPLKPMEFEHQIFKVEGADKYDVTLNLNGQQSDLLTFAIFSRDFDKDIYNQITPNSAASQKGTFILIFCIVFSISGIISIEYIEKRVCYSALMVE